MCELIKHFEGYRSEAYQDSAGIWTIGYGHTKGVKRGMTCTKEQADKWLKEDLKDAEKRVDDALSGIPLTENERKALVSLAYNLRSFETLANHLKEDRERFKRKMLLYCRDVSKNYLKGLKIRRIAERLLFEGKDWLGVALEMQKLSVSKIVEKEKELFV